MPYIFLLGALVLAWPVATVYLLISHNALKRTVKTLQADIAKLGHTDTPDTPDTSATSGATSGAIWGATSGQTLPPRAARARPSANRHTPIGPAPSTQPTPLAKAAPTQAIVLTHANGQRLVSWVGANWVYVIAAISLALAGVFLVQYSVENGLLSPTARIVAALLFGAVLIVGGDLLRRRSGDTPQATTAYLPSVFSGAGLVTLFAAVIAARTLYALISPEVTFAGLVSVALGGLVLGWFYGPLLAAIGLIGAFGAPFVVGESSDTTPLLYGYFIILAALGLGIDTVRRWAWVTALTLVLGYICGWLIWMPSLEMGPALACYLVALVGLAITIPVRRLRPDHTGMMILPRLVLGMQASRPTDSAHTVSAPAFPVSVAFGAMLATTLGLVLLTQNDPQVFWVSTGVLAGLACLTTLASHRATALQDTAILPVGGFLAVIFGQTTQAIGLWPAIAAITPIPEHPTGTFFLQGSNPTLLAALGLLVMAAVMSTCALTRGLRPPIQEPSPQGLPAWFGVIWAAVAALTPPLTLIFLDLIWEPAPRIGPMSWALCALGVAALMVVYADRLARHDGPTQRLRMSLPVLSALSTLTFACVIVFTDTALTLAMAAMLWGAALLDRRYQLPQMTIFILTGVVGISYRLVMDPGLAFAIHGPLPEVIAAYLGPIVGFCAALSVLAGLDRPKARSFLGSAAWTTAGVFVSILLFRWLNSLSGGHTLSHWAMGLFASIWLILMLAQIHRMSLGGALQYLRIGLAGAYALFSGALLAASLLLLNPLWGGSIPSVSIEVIGPPVVNSLAIAYLLPAGILIQIPRYRAHLHRHLWITACALAVVLGAVWIFAALRHVWQGSEGMDLSHPMTQPELYSYTVVLLLVGAGLFYQSLARRAKRMRQVGLAVIGLAVIKVFFVDISELNGLTRVFSFLLLGLALAGLAWLERWANRGSSAPPPDTDT